MRRLIANRFTVLTMVGMGIAYYAQGPVEAGHFCQVMALILWLLAGRPRLWPRVYKAQPIGNHAVRPAGRESKDGKAAGIDAAHARLDPEWQHWLASQDAAEGRTDGR